jgi:hypothetical protein
MGKSLAKKLVDYDYVEELVVIDKDNKALDYVRNIVNSYLAQDIWEKVWLRN